jgi:Sec-independent protein secretion pathway component TatC
MIRLRKLIGLALIVPFVLYNVVNFVNVLIYLVKNINTDFAQQVLCLILSLVLFTIGMYLVSKK